MEKKKKTIIFIIFLIMLLIIIYLGYRLSVEKKISLDTQPINFSTENTEKDKTIKELNDKINELTNSNNDIDAELESAITDRDKLIAEKNKLIGEKNKLIAEKATCKNEIVEDTKIVESDVNDTINELEEKINNKNTLIDKLEEKINNKNTLISDLQDSKDALLAQIKVLKEELDKVKNTYTVFYVADDVTIYKEKVYKGEDVNNIPDVPTFENYLGEWTNDGKNIQNDIVIYAKYYYKLTIDIGTSDGNPVAYSNIQNNILKLYREDSKEITFYNNTIKSGDDVLLEMTFYPDFEYYNQRVWQFDPDTYTHYSDHTFEVTESMTLYYRPYYGCIAAGSKISMADGSVKLVEDISVGDSVLSYDKFTGTITSHEIINIYSAEDYSRVFTVKLANGNKLDIVDFEFLFDTDKKEYIPINITTYESMIGKNVMINDNGNIGYSKIVSITMEEKVIEHYTLYTETVLNYIANDIIGQTPIYFTNMLYTINDDYKIDYNKYNSEINKYGIYTYEDFKDVCSKEVFDAFRIKDFKIAVEKGLITFEQLRNGLKEFQEDVDLGN